MAAVLSKTGTVKGGGRIAGPQSPGQIPGGGFTTGQTGAGVPGATSAPTAPAPAPTSGTRGPGGGGSSGPNTRRGLDSVIEIMKRDLTDSINKTYFDEAMVDALVDEGLLTVWTGIPGFLGEKIYDGDQISSLIPAINADEIDPVEGLSSLRDIRKKRNVEWWITKDEVVSDFAPSLGDGTFGTEGRASAELFLDAMVWDNHVEVDTASGETLYSELDVARGSDSINSGAIDQNDLRNRYQATLDSAGQLFGPGAAAAPSGLSTDVSQISVKDNSTFGALIKGVTKKVLNPHDLYKAFKHPSVAVRGSPTLKLFKDYLKIVNLGPRITRDASFSGTEASLGSLLFDWKGSEFATMTRLRTWLFPQWKNYLDRLEQILTDGGNKTLESALTGDQPRVPMIVATYILLPFIQFSLYGTYCLSARAQIIAAGSQTGTARWPKWHMSKKQIKLTFDALVESFSDAFSKAKGDDAAFRKVLKLLVYYVNSHGLATQV